MTTVVLEHLQHANSSSPDLTVGPDGNIGIGTSSPDSSAKLHIKNDSGCYLSIDAIGSQSSNGNASISFYNDASNKADIIFHRSGLIQDLVFRNNVGGQGILFRTNGNNDRMYINSSGNVGVGTTSPSDKLTVSGGHINLTSSAYGIKLPGAITSDGQINHVNAGSEVTLQTYPLSNQTLRLKGLTDKIYYHSDRGNPDYGEVFGIDTYGRVAMPYQPAFSAVCSNHAVNGDLVFDAANINRGNHYNTSNGRFTAPIAGAYAFMFYGMAENGNGNIRGRIQINGAAHPSGEHYGGVMYQASGTYQQMVLTTILDLNAGDYVNIHWQSTYGAMHSWHNKFSGWLLG